MQYLTVVLALGVDFWPFIRGTVAFIVSFLFMFAILAMRNKIIGEEEEPRLQGDQGMTVWEGPISCLVLCWVESSVGAWEYGW